MAEFVFELQRFAEVIEGTDGDDNLSNIDDNVSIVGGNGNDSINNFGNNVTILGGTGDNYVDNNNGINYEGNHGIAYIYGGGNDTIESFIKDDDFIIIEGYSWEIVGAVNEVGDYTGEPVINILDGSETIGSIKLTNYWADAINILSSKEEFAALNLISNEEDNQTLTGTNAKDVITNSGKNVSIVGNANNDSIYNYDESGINNDATGKSSKSTIYGGAGDDYITNRASNVTVFGGDGNDYVKFDTWLYAADMVYVYGGGNDTLDRFNHRASIVLGDVKINSTLDTGEALVLRLNNGKTLTLTNGGYNTNIVSSLDEVPKINVTHNDKSNVVVTGKKEDGAIDFIFNDYDSNNVTINGSDNNDMISNDGDKVLINAGAGDDIIDNDESNATINAGAGNDTIVSFWDNVSIDSGNGNDSIVANGEKITINGGEGDDTIENNGNNNLILYNSGNGNDVIRAFGENNTLQILSGTVDEVSRDGDNVLMTLGENVVTVEGSNINIIDQDGNAIDIPEIEYDIENHDSNVTVNGTNDSDKIYNDGSNVSLDAGAGNNFVVSNANDVTVKAGSGDDYIKIGDSGQFIYGNIYIYGGGNDTLVNFDRNAYIVLGDTKIESASRKVDENGTASLVFSLSNGKTFTMFNDGGVSDVSSLDEIPKINATYNNESNVVVTGKQEAGTIDLIFNDNDASGATVNGSDISDHIINKNGGNVLINGGAERDTIENAGSNATINGDDGDDELPNDGANVEINGGAGNDHIYNSSESNNATTNGGAGDDTIQTWGGNELVRYSGGNDLITAFGDDDTLQIMSGTISEINSDGDRTFLTIGENVVTVEGTLVNVIDKDGNAISTNNDFVWKRDGNKITYGSEDDAQILLELDGVEEGSEPTLEDKTVRFSDDNFSEAGVTVISNAGGYVFEIAEDSYSSGTFFKGSDGKDTIANNGEYLNIDAGAGKDSIINNAANVTIAGGAGNDKILNNSSNVEISGGAGNDNVTISGGEQSKNIFAYSNGDGKDILYNFTENDTIKIADDSAVEANIDGNDIEFKIGNGSIKIKDGASSEREVTIVDSAGSEIESLSGNKYTTDGVISQDEDGESVMLLAPMFKGNYTASAVAKVDGSQTKKGIGIDASNAGIVLIGGKGKDTLISGENTFEMTGGKGNDIFTYNGGTGIITDYDKKDKIALGESLSVQEYEIAGDNIILGFSENDSLTIEGGKGAEISFGAKKSTVNIYDDAGILDGKKKSIKLLSDTETFDATSSKDYSKLVTIDGAAAEGEISITGNKKKNYIVAGENGATLSGGKGKDSLVGGDEADTFVFDSKNGKGNKVIIGYSNDDGDQIVLNNDATISEVKAKGKDLVLKVDKNKITLKEIGDNPFTFVENGVAKTYSGGLLISADKESVTMTSAADRTIDLSSEAYDETNYQNVSAELLKKSVSITGNTEDNILTGGKGKDSLVGGDSSDTLRGGKGNDTLWGGSPNESYNDADTFVFWAGDGNDTIMDYSFAQGDLLQILSKNGDKDATFTGKFDDNTLTLNVNGGGKVILNDVSASTRVNINGTSQTVRQWTR